MIYIILDVSYFHFILDKFILDILVYHSYYWLFVSMFEYFVYSVLFFY